MPTPMYIGNAPKTITNTTIEKTDTAPDADAPPFPILLKPAHEVVYAHSVDVTAPGAGSEPPVSDILNVFMQP